MSIAPYYEQDGISIYAGNAMEIADALEFDVIVTDPPYGTGQKIAYRPYRDTMDNWSVLMAWLLEHTHPTAFTISHSRLFDLPKRPQWMGCWDKQWPSGLVHIGAGCMWEPICFYNLPRGDQKGAKRWDDVFRCPTFSHQYAGGSDVPLAHPCPKPSALFERIISVMPDGVILDPMCGSGATLRAAKNLGRRAIGIDLSPEYCDVAIGRLAQGVLL